MGLQHDSLPPAENDLAFLQGGGDTGALIREYHWQATPLGCPHAWPPSLRTAVTLMLGSVQPVYIAWGPNLTSLYNDGYLPIVGTKHPGIGLPFFELWAEIEDQFRPIVDATLRGEAQHFIDLQIALAGRPGLPQGYFTFSYTPLRDDAGDIRGFYVAATETTGRVLTERRREALLELDDVLTGSCNAADISSASSRILASALGACRAGYGDIDPEAGTITIAGSWNDPNFPAVNGTYQFTDYGSYIQELRRGQTVAVADVEQDLRTADKAHSFAVLGIRAHLDVPVAEGGRTVAQVFVHSAEPRRWSAEEIEFARAFAERTRAAVARRSAEHAARIRSAELESLLISSPLGACFFDREHRWLRINQELADINGYAIEEHIGRRIEDLLPINARTVVPILDEVFATGRIFRNAEITGETPAAPGQIRHWLVSYYPVRDDRGDVISVGAWVVDITDRKDAEQELARSEALLRAVVEAAPVGLVFADCKGELTGGNARIEEIVGHPVLPSANVESYGEWIGYHADGRRVEADEYPMAKVIREESDRAELEVLYERGDGRNVWLRFIAAAVRDANGVLLGGVVATLDIDRERRLTDQLERAVEEAVAEREAALAQLHEIQKLETIGQMTGGVAHDFNNLLTPIVGSLDMLQRKELGTQRDQRLIEGALEAAERARTLVQRLLAFARRAPLQNGAIDVLKLVEGMRDLIERSIGPMIALDVKCDKDLPKARVDANQLELALLNLALNARDAMPNGGSLIISAEKRNATAPSGVRSPLGEYVCITVTDTGCGMDPETLRRCVEPFYTSKGVGRGTGLGLSMVHGLCGQSGGNLVMESASGQGTTAELWLPIAPAELIEEAVEQPQVSSDQRSGIVLVVDDEPLARECTAAMCAEFGYQVLEAGSADEALDLLQTEDVKVLVTDYLMPGTTGTELAHTACKIRPNLQVLLVTGYSRMDQVDSAFMRLEKPFRQIDLADRLDALTLVE